MEVLNVKLHLVDQGTFHRSSISSDMSFEDFCRSVNLSHVERTTLEYKDDDGDWVEVDSDTEWHHALEHHMLSKQVHNRPLDVLRLRLKQQQTSLLNDQSDDVVSVAPSVPVPPPFDLSKINFTSVVRQDSLADMITSAKSSLRKANRDPVIVQEYFSVSGVPRNEFLMELETKIAQQPSRSESHKESQRVRNMKMSLHQELLSKQTRAKPTAASDKQSNPLFNELLRRHKQFSARSTEKKQKQDELLGFEWIDQGTITPPAAPPGWLYSIFSRINF